MRSCLRELVPFCLRIDGGSGFKARELSCGVDRSWKSHEES